MTKSSSRRGRLSDVLHRELAKLIRDEVSDPRIGMVTISGVEVSDDLSFAKVYVTVMNDEQQESSIEALNHAAGFFRTQLSKHLTLRVAPRVRFIYDDSLRLGSRIDQLLKSVLPEEPINPDNNENEDTK